MKSRDERACNLLSRLFAYAPRKGRDALEDYCTEALAYCLCKSPDFLSRFLKLTGIPALRDWKERAEVHTQVRFTGIDSDDTEEDPSGGRFDLVIESGVLSPFVLVIESKVGSSFRRNQLQNYRAKLNYPDAFPGVPRGSRYLVTLTTIRPASRRTNAKITWPQVWDALTRSARPDEPFVAEVFSQFAAFLREKGLSMLELKKTDEAMLAQWSAIKEFEGQLTRIVKRLRNQDEVKRVVGRKQVKPEEAEWIGVYGKDDFWAGFGVLKTDDGPELNMWVEITVPGDRRKWIQNFSFKTEAAFMKPRRYLEFSQDHSALNCGNLTDGNSRFVFAKRVSGELDGKGEAVFEWLYDMSKYVIALAERAQKRVT